jgi:hypothetical protein
VDLQSVVEPAAEDAFNELETVHVRHAYVGEHDVEATFGFDQLERFSTVANTGDAEPTAQSSSHGPTHDLFIVDEKEMRPVGGGCR